MRHSYRSGVLITTATLSAALVGRGVHGQCETQVLGAHEPADAVRFGRTMAMGERFLALSGAVDAEGNAAIRLRQRPEVLTQAWDILDGEILNDSSTWPEGLTHYGSAMAAADDLLLIAGAIDADGDGYGEPYVRMYRILTDGGATFVDAWHEPVSVRSDSLFCETQSLAPPRLTSWRLALGGFVAPTLDGPAQSLGAELMATEHSLSRVRGFAHQFASGTSWSEPTTPRYDVAWSGPRLLLMGPAGAADCPQGWCIEVAALDVVNDEWIVGERAITPPYGGEVLYAGLSDGNRANGPFVVHAVAGEGDVDADGRGRVRADVYHNSGEDIVLAQVLPGGLGDQYMATAAHIANFVSERGDGAFSFVVTGLRVPFLPKVRSQVSTVQFVETRQEYVFAMQSWIEGGLWALPWMSTAALDVANPAVGREQLLLMIAGGEPDGDDGRGDGPPAVVAQLDLLEHDGGDVVAGCFCPTDLTGDGATNVFDLLELLGSWGSGGAAARFAEPRTTTNAFDLLYLLSHWGVCDGK